MRERGVLECEEDREDRQVEFLLTRSKTPLIGKEIEVWSWGSRLGEGKGKGAERKKKGDLPLEKSKEKRKRDVGGKPCLQET